MVSNLSQFKKYIENGGTYKVLEHNVWQDSVGEIRKPTKTQGNGFYAKAINRDDSCKTNMGNGGLGLMNWYGKASEYQFDGNVMTRFFKDGSIWYRFEMLREF